MDLLKMALRLQPWLSSELIGDCLEVALVARTLDVAASPYDCTAVRKAKLPEGHHLRTLAPHPASRPASRPATPDVCDPCLAD
tara:strand:+ start:870 stop:1118 length:249 start_codon:yes stop_codon:yes gene_type:complete